ncbi:hypothetical protein DID77_04055 [Candidatus Marinamargulisbacteria bacterium SCGC AG-439-L15]|nr:hypothetical protein DID77_04055 [Candidatus Marinamargulisbacteria bacterium SCGC AG-439-L15]
MIKNKLIISSIALSLMILTACSHSKGDDPESYVITTRQSNDVHNIINDLSFVEGVRHYSVSENDSITGYIVFDDHIITTQNTQLLQRDIQFCDINYARTDSAIEYYYSSSYYYYSANSTGGPISRVKVQATETNNFGDSELYSIYPRNGNSARYFYNGQYRFPLNVRQEELVDNRWVFNEENSWETVDQDSGTSNYTVEKYETLSVNGRDYSAVKLVITRVKEGEPTKNVIEYFTSDGFYPIKRLSNTSESGATLNVELTDAFTCTN